MDFYFAKQMLKERNLLISAPKLANCWQKVLSHQHKYETFEHFVSKACVAKLIMKRDGKYRPTGIATEYEFPSGRIVDVLQFVEKNKELVGYEIESINEKKRNIKEVPIVTINLIKAPTEVHNAFKILEEFFRKFVVEVE